MSCRLRTLPGKGLVLFNHAAMQFNEEGKPSVESFGFPARRSEPF